MKRGDHKGPCTSHRLYHLTCEEFGALLAAYGDLCGICKTRGSETSHGYLAIDHDYEHGYWAVRGMLCATCNKRLGRDNAFSPAAAAYLADPWWKRRLAELGLSAEPLPEPPIGTIVAGRSHYWYRTKRGWMIAHPNLRGGPMTWAGLNHALGPYNIRIPPKTDRHYGMLRERGLIASGVA